MDCFLLRQGSRRFQVRAYSLLGVRIDFIRSISRPKWNSLADYSLLIAQNYFLSSCAHKTGKRLTTNMDARESPPSIGVKSNWSAEHWKKKKEAKRNMKAKNGNDMHKVHWATTTKAPTVMLLHHFFLFYSPRDMVNWRVVILLKGKVLERIHIK